ncbi:unnamed protein product [Parascedosporium putredinis]|uniref:CFEM domain-containing protein n=1 Tax=Parascedosporium putredinis TaxID=1442378 RepID=A0A9P1H6E7_9PEZI|nr:unnamed protein product [Parascedosporium putredinis]CAI7998637.1 unnamed protein product [Parascedosporium putredinis]
MKHSRHERSPCAQSCVNGATSGTKIAGCNQGDIGCVCANSQFLDSIACCLADACDEAGQKAAVSFARALCGGAGVTVPEEVVCKSGGGGDSTASSTDKPTGADTSAGPDSTADSTADAPAATTSAAGDSAGAALTPVGGLLGGALAALFLL